MKLHPMTAFVFLAVLFVGNLMIVLAYYRQEVVGVLIGEYVITSTAFIAGMTYGIKRVWEAKK